MNPRSTSVHGTRCLYLVAQCRCSRCTAANAAYVTAWRHRSDPNKSSLVSHGISRYAAGCRCEICRAANTASARRRRARKAGGMQ